MRIDTKTIVPITSSEPRSSGATAPGKPATGDVVNISSAGAAMSSDGSNQAIINRIQEIRAQLAHGAYPIDLDRLATNIVNDEMLRGGK